LVVLQQTSWKSRWSLGNILRRSRKIESVSQEVFLSQRFRYFVAHILFFALCCGLSTYASFHLPDNSAFSFWYLATALLYPLLLRWIRPQTGFWLGAMFLLLVLIFAELFGFFFYEIRTGEIRYGFGEDLEWLGALVFWPMLLISSTAYILSYGILRLLRKLSS